MMTLTRVSLKLRRAFDSFRKECHGQDLIEYALMAGFVAVAVGAIFPDIAASANVIFSKVNSVMILAGSS